MNVTIQKANRKDAEAVYVLICDLENTHFPKKAFVNLFNQNCEDDRIGYFVAQVDEKIVGFGSIYVNSVLHHCGNVAEIQELIVASNYRDNNIGSGLVDKMIKWSEQQGTLQVEVTCNNSRIEAIGFYEMNGFVRTHQKLVYKRQ